MALESLDREASSSLKVSWLMWFEVEWRPFILEDHFKLTEDYDE